MDTSVQRKENKTIVFRPHRQYRILVGQSTLPMIQKDLLSYNHHLYRVFTAVHEVDNQPPFLHPYNYVNKRKLIGDALRLQRVDKENKNLVGRINAINRSPAIVDCWNNVSMGKAQHRECYNQRQAVIMIDNVRILRTIHAAKSLYARSEMKQRWERMNAAFDKKCKLTKALHIEKPLDKILAAKPSLTRGLAVDFVFPRRKAFLDFSFKDGVRLGQVVVELYYEYAPKMVTNFLAHCDNDATHSYKNSRIHYGEKGRYIAMGDVTCNNGKGGHTIYKRGMNVKPNELKATRSGLLLALPVKVVEKFDAGLTIQQRIRQPQPPPKYNSQFVITLSKCQSETGKMPIFGKVIKGNAVLLNINDMLRTCGSPLETIIISRCGRVPQTAEEIALTKKIKEQLIADEINLESTSESEGDDFPSRHVRKERCY